VPDVAVVALEWVALGFGLDNGTYEDDPDSDDSVAASGTRSWRLSAKILRALRILRAVRLIRIVKIRYFLEKVKDHVQSVSLLLSLKLSFVVLGIVVCAHYLACYWHFMTTLTPDWVALPTTWLQYYGFEKEETPVVYMASLHWSLAQSGFIGSMEIHPTNIAEQLYSCFVTMFWLILCSLFFSCMTLWAIQLRDLGLDREKQEALVRTFVKERRISDNLSNKVIRFFRLNYNKLTLRKKESAIPLFNDLPIDMRIEVHKEVYRPMLRKHPAFPLLFDEDSINSICHLVTVDMHYLAGQTIFSVGGGHCHALHFLGGARLLLRVTKR
jgi:hypothetical protein